MKAKQRETEQHTVQKRNWREFGEQLKYVHVWVAVWPSHRCIAKLLRAEASGTYEVEERENRKWTGLYGFRLRRCHCISTYTRINTAIERQLCVRIHTVRPVSVHRDFVTTLQYYSGLDWVTLATHFIAFFINEIRYRRIIGVISVVIFDSTENLITLNFSGGHHHRHTFDQRDWHSSTFVCVNQVTCLCETPSVILNWIPLNV